MEIGKWRAETGARNPPRKNRNTKNRRSETGARQPNPRECRGFSHTGNNTPETRPPGIRTQNCNLELSHAHIHDEESCDSPSGQFSAGLETDGLPFRNRRTCESIPPLIAGGGERCAPKISIE